MVNSNAFALTPFKADPKVTKFDESDEYIITRELKEDYIPQNNGVVKETNVYVTSKVNRKEYIQSFKDEVGLENILRKVEMTGDVALLDQTHRVPGAIADDGKEVLVDYTKVPSSPEEAAKIIEQGRAVFSNIPDDLKANRSFVDFVEGCTDAEVKAYLQAVLKKSEVDKNE